jgi:GTP cyclohydrolase I
MKASKETPFNLDQIERGVRSIIKGLGLDPTDPNYAETPERYCRFLLEMFCPKETEYITFPEQHGDFIMFRNHKMFSLCPHHLLPVEFTVSIAYMPDKEVLGLSKLVRILHEVNREPLLQERFTSEVAQKFYELVPGIKGSACYVVGKHDCARIRGVKSEGNFVTYKLLGEMSDNHQLEMRFMSLAAQQ